VTLIFDLLTLVSESRVTWATSERILGLSALDLGPIYVTSGSTYVMTASSLNTPAY